MLFPEWLVAAASGAILIGLALLWRLGHRSGVRRRIRAALRDRDPQRRRAGVLVATEQGLRVNAALLVDHIDRERSPIVLDALAEAVLRNSWDPADQPAMLRLRLWAHERRLLAPAPVGPAADDRASLDDAFDDDSFEHAVGDRTAADRVADRPAVGRTDTGRGATGRGGAGQPASRRSGAGQIASRHSGAGQAASGRGGVGHAASGRPGAPEPATVHRPVGRPVDPATRSVAGRAGSARSGRAAPPVEGRVAPKRVNGRSAERARARRPSLADPGFPAHSPLDGSPLDGSHIDDSRSVGGSRPRKSSRSRNDPLPFEDAPSPTGSLSAADQLDLADRLSRTDQIPRTPAGGRSPRSSRSSGITVRPRLTGEPPADRIPGGHRVAQRGAGPLDPEPEPTGRSGRRDPLRPSRIAADAPDRNDDRDVDPRRAAALDWDPELEADPELDWDGDLDWAEPAASATLVPHPPLGRSARGPALAPAHRRPGGRARARRRARADVRPPAPGRGRRPAAIAALPPLVPPPLEPVDKEVDMSTDADRSGGPVLVTGAGGAAGIAVIQALRERGRPVVAADCDPDAVGLHLVPDGGVVPRGDSPDFAAHITKLATRFRATALICTVSEEIEALQDGAGLLAEAGLRSWLPGVETVRTCTDKWRFAKACAAAAMPVPATGFGTVTGVPGPWIVKPRFGRGSRDVHSADNRMDVAWVMSDGCEPMVQTRLTGPRVHRRPPHRPQGRARRRGAALAGRDEGGISTKGDLPQTRGWSSAVGTAAGRRSACGPRTCRASSASDGDVSLIEVNPRFSGGLPLSLAAGADFVVEYLRGIAGRAAEPERLQFRAGVTHDAPLPRGEPAVRILVALGTRPEIVKLAPVIARAARPRRSGDARSRPVSTPTPRSTDDFLAELGLVPDELLARDGDEASRRRRARSTLALRGARARIRATRCCSSATRTPCRCSALAARAGSACRSCTSKPGCARSTRRSLEEVAPPGRRGDVASLHFAPTELAARFLDAEGVDPTARRRRRQPGHRHVARRAVPPRGPVDERAGVLLTAHRRHQRRHPERLRRAASRSSRPGARGRAGDVPGAPAHGRAAARNRRGPLSCRRWPGVTLTRSVAVPGDARGGRLGAGRGHRFRRAPGGGVVVRRPRRGVAPVDARAGKASGSAPPCSPVSTPRVRSTPHARFSSPPSRRRSTRCPAPTATGTSSERLASALDDPAVLDLLTLDEPDLRPPRLRRRRSSDRAVSDDRMSAACCSTSTTPCSRRPSTSRAVACGGRARHRVGHPHEAFARELKSVAAEGSDRGRIIDQRGGAGRSFRRVSAPLVDVFHEYTPEELDPYPGVVDGLEALGERFQLGLVTDGHPAGQRAKVRALGLDGVFDVEVYSDEFGREAPQARPLPFLTGLGRLGVDAGDAMFVGDRPARTSRARATSACRPSGCGPASTRPGRIIPAPGGMWRRSPPPRTCSRPGCSVLGWCRRNHSAGDRTGSPQLPPDRSHGCESTPPAAMQGDIVAITATGAASGASPLALPGPIPLRARILSAHSSDGSHPGTDFVWATSAVCERPGAARRHVPPKPRRLERTFERQRGIRAADRARSNICSTEPDRPVAGAEHMFDDTRRRARTTEPKFDGSTVK